jgi:uncharacterized caspase-like protein
MVEILKSLGYEITDDSKLIGNITEERMRNAIKEFFKTAKYTDTLLFYFSGHGIPEINGDLYLASSEIDYSFPEEGGFSFDRVTKMMRLSSSVKKWFFLIVVIVVLQRYIRELPMMLQD